MLYDITNIQNTITEAHPQKFIFTKDFLAKVTTQLQKQVAILESESLEDEKSRNVTASEKFQVIFKSTDVEVNIKCYFLIAALLQTDEIIAACQESAEAIKQAKAALSKF